jgi:galactokinase
MYLMRLDNDGIQQEHRERFGVNGKVFAAPGRVNLIGEHTDYTGGFVMPMAIEFQTRAVISPRDDGRAVFYSSNFKEEISVLLDATEAQGRQHWSDYPAGVLWSLRQAGISVNGLSLSLSGDIPLGAGLSSSASVEVASAMAILWRAGVTLGLEKIATLCQLAENEYVGAKSGIMDQFIAAGGVADRAMLLDCRSLEYDMLPLPSDVRVVICNSMVKHRIAAGEYGNRRDEVEAGQAVLRRERPEISLLRDATVRALEECAELMSLASLMRCRHIITENARVLAAKQALIAGDMRQFGEIMVEAHASVRDDFAASCAEVDTLVEIAVRQKGCYGARITGGGFGGCTVNIVEAARASEFVEAVRREYEMVTGISADCFVCAASDGALALAAKGGGV